MVWMFSPAVFELSMWTKAAETVIKACAAEHTLADAARGFMEGLTEPT